MINALARTGKGAYEYFVLDLKRKAKLQLPALEKKGLVPLAQFHNRKGETYGLSCRPPARSSPDLGLLERFFQGTRWPGHRVGLSR